MSQNRQIADYQILQGDCRKTLKTLAEKSINTCVTSPPYFGLRNYNDEEDQIGLEQTPDDFVESLVDVFREVHRVLRDDGTLWLNLGDSYYNYRPGKAQAIPKQSVSNADHNQDNPQQCARRANKLPGLKEKDLIGIPWRVAFALQADGWYLRQDIIWNKPNPMPESVRDRCTKSHEYIFLLTKQPKYYFNSEIIKEDGVIPAGTKGAKGSLERQNQEGVNARPPEYKVYDGKRNKRSVWTVNTKPYKGAHFATFPPDLIRPCVLAGCPKWGTVLDPFGGSGTTAQVALENDRNAILCELSKEYIPLIEQRVIVYDKPLEEFMT